MTHRLQRRDTHTAAERARAQTRDRLAREILRRRRAQALEHGPAAIADARHQGRADAPELAQLAARLLEHIAPESTVDPERHALLVARAVLRARGRTP